MTLQTIKIDEGALLKLKVAKHRMMKKEGRQALSYSDVIHSLLADLNVTEEERKQFSRE